MADQPVDKTLLPSLVPQNPAPFEQDSQGRKNVVRSQVDRIMEVFLQVLPSNYVSQVSGPFYTIQLQSIAERIADFQITAQEVMADSVFDYTRSEVLYQITDTYNPERTTGFAWNDPEVAIAWPIAPAVMSESDWSHANFTT